MQGRHQEANHILILFVSAAKKLGVELSKPVIAFEDGDGGVKAAEEAGMKWIRIDKVI
ncbi:MAG: hypothetical protein WKG06_36670 [Segetibacter sp.]